MQYDNSAARLRAILEQGKAMRADQPCVETWNALLQAGGDRNLLIRRLALVQLLPSEVEDLITAHFPISASHIHHWRDPLNTAFLNQNLAGQWVTFAQHVPDHVVSLLAQAEEMLHMKLPMETAKDDDLTKITEMFKVLAADVASSSLPGALKIYVSQGIADLLRAVRDYKYSGTQPILKQTESLVGHAVVDPAYKSFLTDHELGKRLLENLTATALIFDVTLAAVQIPVALQALIGG